MKKLEAFLIGREIWCVVLTTTTATDTTTNTSATTTTSTLLLPLLLWVFFSQSTVQNYPRLVQVPHNVFQRGT